MPSPDHLAAVLFDMDGTLVDTEDLWWDACAEVARGLGAPLGPGDRQALFGLPVEDAAAHVLGRVSDDPGRDSVEAMLTGAFVRRIENGVTPLPGAVALLESLRVAGVPAVLVSASPRTVVDIVLEIVGGHLFRLSVAAGDSARNKPAPDPYLAAASRLGADPAACVAVEDSPTGIASARAAGCAVIAVGPLDAASGVTTVPTLESVDLPLLRRLVSGQVPPGA
ncbi:HAD family phosphatase [Microbispora cellulosiformans]|uniref:HAD family phosphatase n=1 Tax=Microbispora cellulosiformans TaxID=2614688 RepID=A0A5J5K265_9ACTN|nr:HAD family phosphatase [Microbispora cellulosiformans]KAA9376816.1 HAD family phosphatase [Microbispora cellulosiformans]